MILTMKAIILVLRSYNDNDVVVIILVILITGGVSVRSSPRK